MPHLTPDEEAALDARLTADADDPDAWEELSPAPPVVLAAQRMMADRDRFVLSDRVADEWEAINARPARDLPGLRTLTERPSPFDE